MNGTKEPNVKCQILKCHINPKFDIAVFPYIHLQSL